MTNKTNLEAIKLIEKMKKKPTIEQVRCPENRTGCLVYHTELRLSDEDKAHNQCIDDILAELKAL